MAQLCVEHYVRIAVRRTTASPRDCSEKPPAGRSAPGGVREAASGSASRQRPTEGNAAASRGAGGICVFPVRRRFLNHHGASRRRMVAAAAVGAEGMLGIEAFLGPTASRLAASCFKSQKELPTDATCAAPHHRNESAVSG